MASNSEDNQTSPDILDYLDFRSFISDRLAYLQSQNKKFSQRWLAKQAKFKSPHLLSMILAGKRNLSKELTPNLISALGLGTREAEYFQLIVELSQTDRDDFRQKILKKIRTSFQHGMFKGLTDQGLEVLRAWYIPAVRELVTLRSFRNSPKWIAEILGLTENQAADSLELLLAKDFLRPKSDGFVRTEPSLHNLGKCPPMIIGKYQLEMIDQAFKAAAVPTDRRYFECLTFAIPRQLFPQLQQAVKRFCREVDTLVESQGEREEVYHLNVQVFPLSKTAWDQRQTTENP